MTFLWYRKVLNPPTSWKLGILSPAWYEVILNIPWERCHNFPITAFISMQFGKNVESRLKLKLWMRVTFGIVMIWAKTGSPLLQPPGPNKIKTGSRNAICSTQLILSPLIHQLLLWTQHNGAKVLHHTNCILWPALKLKDLPIQDPDFDHHNPQFIHCAPALPKQMQRQHGKQNWTGFCRTW